MQKWCQGGGGVHNDFMSNRLYHISASILLQLTFLVLQSSLMLFNSKKEQENTNFLDCTQPPGLILVLTIVSQAWEFLIKLKVEMTKGFLRKLIINCSCSNYIFLVLSEQIRLMFLHFELTQSLFGVKTTPNDS